MLCRCLHTAWPNKADLRRLDAFPASCLRKILRIPYSFISTVSNAEVLSRANHRMLSKILQYRQIMLLKRVADLPAEDVMVRVIRSIYVAYREAADADAQGKVGLLKCTGLIKAWPIVTGVRLTTSSRCCDINGTPGSGCPVRRDLTQKLVNTTPSRW